ncbi:MAG TPA: zinc-dependent metalloprotease family protein [Thermoanaerobaculia bacterium]|nr:zinc-dependent metalloprotease family protein [Thermoanaerobaculia bacterium]
MLVLALSYCTKQEEVAAIPPPLFEDPAGTEPELSSKAARAASSEMFGLPGNSAEPFVQKLSTSLPLHIGDEYMMPLRPDLSYPVTVKEWSRASNSGTVTVFAMKDEQFGQAILSSSEAGLSGTVNVNGQMFLITPIGNGLHRIDEVNVFRLPDDDPPIDDDDDLKPLDPPVEVDDDFRVLLVFTRDLRGFCQQAGHVGEYEKRLQLAMQSVGITTPITVVAYCSEIRSVPGDLRNQLKLIATSSDIRARRAAAKADLVSLIANDGDQCGVAYYTRRPTASSRHRGFSVVHFDCARINESFVHEIGHNLGLLHDRASTATTSTDCNHGYFVSNPQGTQFTDRTIMSLKSSVCPNCVRVLTFSDFAKGHGVPCTDAVNGTHGPADNAVEIQLPFEVARRFY